MTLSPWFVVRHGVGDGPPLILLLLYMQLVNALVGVRVTRPLVRRCGDAAISTDGMFVLPSDSSMLLMLLTYGTCLNLPRVMQLTTFPLTLLTDSP